MIGESIGDYEIIGSLGKGGFGAVWKAKWFVTTAGIPTRLISGQTSHAEYERNRGFLNQEKSRYKNMLI